ncbi:DUF1848 domain-containing protein [Telmatospirillum siberiense]|uniref:DNA repair photolyase n=1 Tax=Telmatospirillum siberiense TaxID=382514 RepID=A0A2N3PSZ1_9PROT|nr:DUF1848 domain-containing protein [Telmatospirillum siberiense]PKU23523.1 DNA repair photolyase [Telmatospirillum siberiense]
MIVSASYRTDIPAFYGQWFENRFRAGFCRVVNPYGGPPARVAMREGVDGYVFWTRHAGPFLPALAEVRRAGLPFIVQYTLTGYPRALEEGVIDEATSLALIRRLSDEYGSRAVVWRYDPILLTELTPPEWHVQNFSRLASRLAGAVDEVVASFVQPYRKTDRNLAAAARARHFSWWTPPAWEKRQAIARLAGIAQAHGMALRLCTQPELESDAVAGARCIDAQRLADLSGRPIEAKTKGNRPGCLCSESRDIGAYDSCPQGCVYCYAVGSRNRAKDRLRGHDPDGEFLIGPAPC